jgi:iron complex outermembrane receptor protein
MPDTSKVRICVRTLLLLAGAALAFPAGPAQAQAADKADQPETPPKEIVVTGSALPTRLDQLAVPVSIVGADQIQKGGVSTNVLDILRKQIPAFAGRSNAGNSNATNNNQRTGGGSSIQLRNLDTLVLVDGRRVAPSAISAVNGKVFVNVAEIPPAAIDHIEVLTDGASAIYGSDAIGGVVNIILKSNYEGGQINARYGGASGNYNEKSVDLSYGFNPFKNTNVTFAASYSKSSPLYQNRRAFASPFYSTGTAVPGAIGNFALASGVTSPTLGTGAATPAALASYINAGATTATAPGTGVGGTYDLSQFNTLLLEQEQKAAAITLRSDLSGNHSFELFADLQYSKNNNFTRFIPAVSSIKVPVGAPFNPFSAATSVVFGDTLAPVTYDTQEESFRGTIGLKGTLDQIRKGWNWEVGYTHSENTIDQTIGNILYTGLAANGNNILNAVTGGYNSAGVATAGGAFSSVFSPSTNGFVIQPALDPFSRSGAINPASLANILTREHIHGRVKLDTFDGKLAGELFHLPGGDVDFAVGASWRRDAISGGPDATNYVHADGTINTAIQSQTVGGLIADPFRGHRTVTAEYGEIRIPVTGADMNVPGFYNFDIVGAVRHEKYSDVNGSSTVPKIGFRWQPVARQITIRGNYSRSYTAPNLIVTSGPINLRIVGSGVIPGAITGAQTATFNGEDGNNPNAQPSKATSYSLGLVLKPDAIPHLKIDVEYSSVKVTGQVQGLGFNNVLIDVNANGAASQFINNVALNNFPGFAGATPGATAFANPGDIAAYVKNPANVTGGNFSNLYIVDRFSNVGLTQVKSLNITTEYEVPTAQWGTFSLLNQTAVLFSFKNQAVPTQGVFDFVGTTTSGGGAQGTLPRLRMYTSLDWSLGHFGAGIAHTYIGPVSDIGAGGQSYANALLANPAQNQPGHVSPYGALDIRLNYHTSDDAGQGKGFSLTAGINNLFDALPPVSSNISPTANAATTATAWRTENNADISTYGPIGRLFYISASVKF